MQESVPFKHVVALNKEDEHQGMSGWTWYSVFQKLGVSAREGEAIIRDMEDEQLERTAKSQHVNVSTSDQDSRIAYQATCVTISILHLHRSWWNLR